MSISRVRIHPGPLGGHLRVPGDKSISHRALLLGAIAGDARVTGLAPSGDVASMASVLQQLGIHVELVSAPDGMLQGRVHGTFRPTDEHLDCGNSGTAMRLLIGTCAAIAGTSTLVGDHSLGRRPMERVAIPLRMMGADVRTDSGGTPPVVVVGGQLRSITYVSPVASAQVKSAIMLAAAAAGVEVTVISPTASRDHSERMLRMLGAEVVTGLDDEQREVVVFTPRALRRDVTFDVPGDPSSAAFWLVAGVLGGREVVIDDVSCNPTRVGVVDILRRMGAQVGLDARETDGEPVGVLRSAGSALAGGVVVSGRTVVDAIDELPILALAGALSRDGLEVRDAAELRTKESDRITATARSLGALGITVHERADGYLVPGGQRPGPGVVDADGDHRIAMTAAIAATVGTGPVDIAGFESVATSYPTFLADLSRLGGSHEVLDDD